MKVLQFPNYQCPLCFAMYVGIISDDHQRIVFRHAGLLKAQEQCDASATTFTILLADCLVEWPGPERNG